MTPIRNIFRSLLFVTLLAGFGLNAQADTMQGEVQRVPPEGKAFDLLRADTNETSQIFLLSETKFNGLSSLLELVKGDEVTVTAQRNVASGHWEADSVTVRKMVIRNPESDLKTLKETPEKSASVASLENETKVRAEKEAKLFLEGFDKEIAVIKKASRKSPELKKKFKQLSKGLKADKKDAWEKLNILKKAPTGACDAAKSDSDASIEVLKGKLKTLKEAVLFSSVPDAKADVVVI